MADLTDIAASKASRHGMLPPGTCVLAMVSGGGDSVALLTLLAGGGFGRDLDVSVLHVNHLLRGAESDGDEEFVRDLCASLAIPCRCVRYDVSAHAQAERLNLEDAGRRIRYRFAEEELDALCSAAGVDVSAGRIAVAHTLDDRVETFLTRLISGSGAAGLASIAPVRGRIVRPLLDATREQVRAYLREIGQPWREDATNADTDRERARVRAELMPALEAFDPRVRETLRRTTDVLAEEDAFLGEMARAAASECAAIRPGREVALDRAKLAPLSRAMRRRVVREALAQAFPDASRLDFAHVDALADAAPDEAFARDLPFGLRAFTEYATLVVSRADAAAPSMAPCLLEVPGNADLGEAGSMSAEEADVTSVAGGPDSIVIDATGLVGPLVVDGVRPGDRMRPLGMVGSRKLSDLLVDAKVPRRARSAVPVVRDGERIVWLAGVRMSDEYRVTGSTGRAIRLEWRRPVDQSEG